MTFTSLLTDSVTLQTAYSSQNSFLDWTYTYSSASTTTKCRLTPISSYERIDPEGRFIDIRYFAYFESGASINEGDRLIHGNETLIVKECIIDAESHHKEAYLAEVTI